MKTKLSTVTQFNPSADRALELAAKYKDELALRDAQNKTLLREKHILENKLQQANQTIDLFIDERRNRAKSVVDSAALQNKLDQVKKTEQLDLL